MSNDKPLEVKHKRIEDMNEEEKAEMETVFRHLAPNYCVCQHRKDKHLSNIGECNHKATRISAFGGIEEYACHCSHFISIQEQAENTPERNY